MDYALISLTYKGLIAELVLSNEKRRNCLSQKAILELRQALTEIEASSARAVILRAAGTVFCSGHDFAEMNSMDKEAMLNLVQSCSNLMQALRGLPQPIVAQVQGPAIGAGCQLALSCDFVVASKNASFQTPGGKAGWFCTTPMVAVSRVLGAKRALEMLMTGDVVSADTALGWGMINKVVEPGQLEVAAEEFAARLMVGSRYSQQLGKRTFYQQLELEEGAAYEVATNIMADSAASYEARETMQAFVEKRKPVFKE